MPVQKLIPRVLNLDDDYLLVKPTEMVDAVDVTVSADDDGNANILKTVQGNTIVTALIAQLMPEATYTEVVGSVINKADNNVYYFIYHSLQKVATSITAAVVGGQYVHTATTSANHAFEVGDVVTITNMANPSRDNGTFIIRTVPTPTTFTYVSGAIVPTATNLVGGGGAGVEINRHSIYCYYPKNDRTYLAYRNYVLKFTRDCFVKADCLLTEDGDTLLYFTDGINEPRKINITRALEGYNPLIFNSPLGPYPTELEGSSSPTPLNSDIERRELFICTAKQPPLQGPDISFITDSTIGKSNIYDKYFQFAYQYIYDDGEVSAISPYSRIAISNEQFLDGFISDDQKDINNVIRLTINNSDIDVAKIKIIGRNKNDGQFFIVDEITNNRAVATTTYDFKNDKVYPYVPDSEVNKLYDAVPLKANAQALAGNRLIYGGYTEFYENTSVDVDSYVRYNEKNRFNTLTASVPNANPVFNTATDAEFSIDLASIGNYLNQSDSIAIDLKIGESYITVNKASNWLYSYNEAFSNVNRSFTALRLMLSDLSINKKLNITEYTSIATIRTQLRDLIQGNYRLPVISKYNHSSPAVNDGATQVAAGEYVWFQGYVIANIYGYTVAGTSIKFKIKFTEYDLFADGLWRSATGAVSFDGLGGLSGTTLDQAGVSASTWTSMRLNKSSSRVYNAQFSYSFKAGVEHEFGVVYYDDKNRSGGVNPIDPVYVQSFGERNSGLLGPTSIVFRIKSQAPEWAKKWQLVYAPYTKYSFVLQYSVYEALYKTSDNSSSQLDRKLYISMRHFDGESDTYRQAKGALIDYQFVEGDILRINRYTSGTGASTDTQIYPNNYDYKILGYQYFDENNTPLADDGSPHWDERKDGWFIIVRDEDYVGGRPSDIDAHTSFWDKNCVVEILRPNKSTDKPVYREFGYAYDVVNTQPNVYKHRGDRDYTFSVPASTGFVVAGMRATNDYEILEGDIIELGGFPTQFIASELVVLETSAGTRWNFSLNKQVGGGFPSAIADGTYFGSIINLDEAVVVAERGDVYYRPRNIKFSQDISSRNNIVNNIDTVYYERHYIEDISVSDFNYSDAHDFGRPNSIIENAKQVYRMASITYSDPFAIDSSVLYLSSFNLSNANFSDYSNRYGAIKYIHSSDQSLTILQESKASLLSLNRNLIEYADGQASLAISSNFLGSQSYYAGDYGVNNNPESVLERDGRIYFCDIVSAKILRLGGDGLTIISENGAGSFIAEHFKSANENNLGKKKLISFYDPDKDYYMFAIKNFYNSNDNLTMSYDVMGNGWVSKHSYIPEAGIPVGNYLMTFYQNRAYKHNDSATRGNIYGVNMQPSFSVICNDNPSAVKVFKSISIESKTPFTFDVSTESQQSTSVSASVLNDTTTAQYDASGNVIGLGYDHKREGLVYAEIPKDSTSANSSIVVLGQVLNVDDTIVAFANPINNIPFQIGDVLNLVNVSSYTSLGVTAVTILDYNQIQFSGTVAGVNPNDTLAVVSSQPIDGDPMRGRYAKVDFSQPTEAFEVYAVNVNYNESKLHFA